MTEANQKLKLLIERFCKGESDAFRQIYFDYRRKVFQLINVWKFPDAAEEDIAQDAWIKFYLKICDVLAEIESPSSYLWRIVTNLCIDHFKATKNAVYADDGAIEIAQNRLDDKQDAVSETKLLIEQINRLPENERRAIILFDKYGYSHKEIAAILNTSEGNSKVLVSRGKAKIREFFNRGKS